MYIEDESINWTDWSLDFQRESESENERIKIDLFH